MTRDRGSLHLYIRIVCLILASLVSCPVFSWIDHSRILVQLSPFVLICAILASGALGAGSILGLLFIIVSIFRKRWFCLYICPVGLILDTASKTGFNMNKWWKGLPSIGKYIAFITFASAIVGYPLLIWMDPLAILNSAVSFFWATNPVAAVLSISAIIVLILLSIASGSIWCARLCPLGGTQDILAGTVYLFNHIFKKDENTQKETGGEFYFPVSRRMVLAIAAGLGSGIWLKGVVKAGTKNIVLRPPGAVKEEIFQGQCVRCGNCSRACPSNIIGPDTGKSGIHGFMTPNLSFNMGYCLENCNDCTMVCPSGAIKKLTLDEKRKHIIGEAVLNPSICYMVRGVNDCNICIRSCPFSAVQTYWDEESYSAFPVVDTKKCNGCGACERFCPTKDIKAITIHKPVIN